MPDQPASPSPLQGSIIVPYPEAERSLTYARGSGGYLSAYGLALRRPGALHDVIELRPVGARGTSHGCLIEIPADPAAVQAVIDALQRFLPPAGPADATQPTP